MIVKKRKKKKELKYDLNLGITKGGRDDTWNMT
jgi:hypothetical protein